MRSKVKGEKSDKLVPHTGKKGGKRSHRRSLATGMLLLTVPPVASHKIEHLKIDLQFPEQQDRGNLLL